MNIKGKIVTLRAIEENDLELLRQMINDDTMEPCVVGWSFPVSKNHQKNWYDNLSNENNQRFIIETEEDGAVGLATLTDIDWKNRSAFHGIKLANKERRSKGIGTDSVMAIMRYAFDELGLNRLDGSWLLDNLPSAGLYKKCGWSVEGVKKEAIYKSAQYKDLAIVGIRASEYYELIENNKYWDK